MYRLIRGAALDVKITRSVTFATSCWQRDWDILLRTKFLQNKINRNDYDFTKKMLIINNVKKRVEVEKFAKEAVNKEVITDYFFVEDHINEALEHFQLSKEALGKGYYYSNHELVSIYLCQTDYLVFFTGDTCLAKKVSWIEPAIAEFETNQNYKVANPVWNEKFEEAKSESASEIENFYIGFGFSDQCFLVRTKDLKAPIYNETNPASERYPKYGGETFEKRVDSWMRNHNFLRLTFKHGSYWHEDFLTNEYLKKIQIKTGKYGN
jgi:hypothetical protein